MKSILALVVGGALVSAGCADAIPTAPASAGPPAICVRDCPPIPGCHVTVGISGWPQLVCDPVG